MEGVLEEKSAGEDELEESVGREVGLEESVGEGVLVEIFSLLIATHPSEL